MKKIIYFLLLILIIPCSYIIRYWLEYLTYDTQEPKIATIDLPITVIPNESEQTFYSSSRYPVPAFEEYDDTLS